MRIAFLIFEDITALDAMDRSKCCAESPAPR